MAAPASVPDRGIFRSPRLIYRAPELSDDDKLFKDLIFDRTAYALSNYTNNRLPGMIDATDYRKYCMEKALIGAIICLPPPPTTASRGADNSFPDFESTEQQQQQVPIPIGEIHLKDFGADRAHHRNTEVGLQILPAYQSQGYGTEALRWILEWAFHHTGLHRVGLKTFDFNVAALRSYTKSGFREEGREREAMWHDGQWHDVVCMSILEYEWRDLQRTKDRT